MPYPRRLRLLLTAACLAGCTSQGPPAAELPIDQPNASAVADPPGESEFAQSSVPVIRLCDKGSSALAQARKRYDALEQLVEALPADGTAAPFNAQATALYRHECLSVARGDEPMLSFELTFGIEAKTYWGDGLGMWLRSYLDLADGTDSTVWLPPTRRDIVTPQTREDDPLVAWLCSADPQDVCARSVAGWASRAQRYFELWSMSGRPSSPDCVAAASEGPAQGAYTRWRSCVSKALARQPSLPVGGLGLVDTGWVALYGRRGHYAYCDGVTAFDLGSGAYYEFALCNHRPELDGLVRAGAVDPPSRSVEVTVGTIALERVREFAWAMMSARYVQLDVVTDRALGTQLPDDVTVARYDDPFAVTGLGLSGTGSSGSTTLGWTWTQRSGAADVFGELGWSYSGAAGDYAARLLSVVRLGIQPGCAPESLPQWVVDNLAVARLPTSELVDPPSAEVLAAMREQVTKGRCG